MFNPEVWFARVAFLFVATVLICLTHVRMQEQNLTTSSDIEMPQLIAGLK